MPGNRPIPAFDTFEEASDFWSSHSSADYDDQWTPVDFNVSLREQDKLIVLEDAVALGVRGVTESEGTDLGHVVNRWLRKRLAAA